MSFIDSYKKLGASDMTIAIGALLGVVCPGFLSIYLFKPSLITSLDTVKLLVFASSLTLPILMINVSIVETHVFKAKLVEGRGDLLFSCGITCGVLYPSILVSYLASLSFKGHLCVLAGAQALMYILLRAAKHHRPK